MSYKNELKMDHRLNTDIKTTDFQEKTDEKSFFFENYFYLTSFLLSFLPERGRVREEDGEGK